MADCGVASSGFHEMYRADIRAACERLFDAPVLVAKGNFQMLDLFAVALETEMPWLDDTCMYRPDSDFVRLAAF